MPAAISASEILVVVAEFAELPSFAPERSVGGMTDMHIGGNSPLACVTGSNGFGEGIGMLRLN